jgi:uncharacterized protein (TIGR02246 family)
MSESVAPSIEEAIRDLEQREAKARAACDLAALDSLWSDTMLINATENLLFTKSQFLARLSSGRLRYTSFTRLTMQARSLTDGVVVTTGSEAVMPASGPDAQMTVFCSYMNVWSKEDGAWRLAARHVAVMTKSETDPLG